MIREKREKEILPVYMSDNIKREGERETACIYDCVSECGFGLVCINRDLVFMLNVLLFLCIMVICF